MKTCPLLLQAASLLLVVCAGSARAADLETSPPFSVSPRELLQLKAPNAPADLDVEVLLFEVNYAFDAKGRLTTERRWVYRVLTERGVRGWASTAASYNPWHHDKPEIRARVITPDGREHQLKQETLVDSAASPQQGDLYSDRRKLAGPLPAVEPGSVIEEVVRTREHQPYFEAGNVVRHFFSPDTYTQVWKVTVTAPKKLPLRFRLRGSRKKPARSVRGGTRQLVFRYEDLLPVKEWPPASHPDYAPVPVLEISSGKSWRAVATRYSQLVDEQLKGFDAKKLSDALVEPSDPRDQKIAKLLKYVHDQVRYTGLELGERSLVPFAPTKTLERHFGDCKDKATLLVGLLRAQGIDAHVALLDSGIGLDVPQKLPGLGLFDHAIVYVGGTSPLWIDATADKAPVGVVPLGDQDRLALIARPSTRALTRIPRGRAQDNVYREDVHVTFADGDKARVVEIDTGTGPTAAHLRSSYDGTDGTLEKKYARYAEQQFDGRLVKARAENTGNVNAPPKLTLEIEDVKNFEMPTEGDGWARVVPGGLYANLPELLFQDDEKEEKRKKREKKKSDEKDPRYRYLDPAQVYVQPHTYQIVYHMTLPPGFRWEGLPETLEMEEQGIRTWRRVRAEGEGDLVLDFGLQTDTRLVPADAIRSVQKALNRFWRKADTRLHYVFGPAWKIAKDEVEAGMAQYRALREASPDNMPLEARYASSLIDLHLGDEARRVAKAMVERWPDEPRAQWTFAWVHLFDPMGRDSWPEADFAAAEAALRKAVELDPEERQYLKMLRVVVEMRGDRGPNPAGVPHEALLELTRQEKERFGDDTLDEEIARRLIWLRRFDEALEVLEDAPDTDNREALWVAATMGAEGPQGAIRKAEELSGGDPSNLLMQAAAGLALMDQGELGMKLAEAYPQLSRTRRGTAIKRELGYLTRRDSCLDAMTPAARAVHDFMLPFVQNGHGHVQIKALRDRKHPAYVDVGAIQGVLHALRPSGSNASLRRFNVQLLPCALAWTTEEKDGAIRVRLHTEGTRADRSAKTFYLQKKRRSYQVVGAQAGYDMASLGRLAMQALRKGKLGEARAWLGWALDHLVKNEVSKDNYSLLSAVRALEPAELSKADKKTLWPLAAALSAWDPMGKPEEKTLRRALKRTTDEAKRFALRFALAVTLMHRQRFAQAADLLAELRRERPGDRKLWESLIRSQYRAERYEQTLRELAAFEAEHKDTEDFASTLRAYSLVATGHGREVIADAMARKEQGSVKAGELNNVAWSALFVDGEAGEALLKDAVALAEESLRLNRSAATMHTLGTLYAAVGDYDKAHRYISQSIKAWKGDDDTSNWYVLGRIADGLGLPGAADAAYGHMKQPEEASLFSTYQLWERLQAERTREKSKG